MELSLIENKIRIKIYNREDKNTTHYYKIGDCEDPREIISNHEYICNDLSGDCLNIMNQVHKEDIFDLKQPFESIRDAYTRPPICDGIVTSLSKQILGVMTADCVPVLLYTSTGNVVSAVHCGWRSAFAKIIFKVGQAIKHKEQEITGSSDFSIKAVIGPSIQVDSYEVDKKFVENFLINDRNNRNFFKIKDDSKFLFDLPKYVKNQLHINEIEISHHFNEDSFQLPEKYPSHRYSTLKGEKYKGSILSTIMITK